MPEEPDSLLPPDDPWAVRVKLLEGRIGLLPGLARTVLTALLSMVAAYALAKHEFESYFGAVFANQVAIVRQVNENSATTAAQEVHLEAHDIRMEAADVPPPAPGAVPPVQPPPTVPLIVPAIP